MPSSLDFLQSAHFKIFECNKNTPLKDNSCLFYCWFQNYAGTFFLLPLNLQNQYPRYFSLLYLQPSACLTHQWYLHNAVQLFVHQCFRSFSSSCSPISIVTWNRNYAALNWYCISGSNIKNTWSKSNFKVNSRLQNVVGVTWASNLLASVLNWCPTSERVAKGFCHISLKAGLPKRETQREQPPPFTRWRLRRRKTWVEGSKCLPSSRVLDHYESF